ncbi:hypothetical protein [Pimelobacter simplex]|uniref:hypothetical protein n=1 Tax=Nocardioides simplex TaxID=2045 RepID=UPI003AAA8385
MNSWIWLAFSGLATAVCVRSAEDSRTWPAALMWLVFALLNLFFFTVRVMEVTA